MCIRDRVKPLVSFSQQIALYTKFKETTIPFTKPDCTLPELLITNVSANANAGNSTISNTSDWNTIQYSNGDITRGAQFHEGRNGSSSGVSQACMVSDRAINNALNKMFQRNYNNGGVTLTVYPPGFQGI